MSAVSYVYHSHTPHTLQYLACTVTSWLPPTERVVSLFQDYSVNAIALVLIPVVSFAVVAVMRNRRRKQDKVSSALLSSFMHIYAADEMRKGDPDW